MRFIQARTLDGEKVWINTGAVNYVHANESADGNPLGSVVRMASGTLTVHATPAELVDELVYS